MNLRFMWLKCRGKQVIRCHQQHGRLHVAIASSTTCINGYDVDILRLEVWNFLDDVS